MVTDDLSRTHPWPRVKWTRAGQVEALLDGGANLTGLKEGPPAQAFSALRSQDRAGAVRFVAQCLPRITAVEWMEACLLRSRLPAIGVQAEARVAVGRWLRDPSEKLRRLAYVAGERAGWDTADGVACLAVFLSGGSLAPADQQQGVQPAPGVFGRTVAGSVLMACLSNGPLAFDRRLDAALDLAEMCAAGNPLPQSMAGQQEGDA